MFNACYKLFASLLRSDNKPTPSTTPVQSFVAHPRPRRRKGSPEPRMITPIARNPTLVELGNFDLATMRQTVQLEDPQNNVMDICWDTERRTVVILNGRTGPTTMVDCTGSNKEGWQLTLEDIMNLLGYDLNNHRLENIWTEEDMYPESIPTCPIVNMSLCQASVVPV